MEIKEVIDSKIKSNICETILRSLPEWFAVEESIVDYTEKVCNMPFFIVVDNSNPIGFVAVKIHNQFTAEVCVMGINNEYHRQGLGVLLIKYVENFCVSNRIKYLTVKTLDSSAVYEPYEKTRKFYSKLGFIPLEVFPLYWDEANPCLFLVKHLECCVAKQTKSLA